MKFFKAFSAVALTATVLCSAGDRACAQSPNQQFGVGASVSGTSAASVAVTGSNIHLAYAINPGFHIGTGFGFSSFTLNKTSITSLSLSPYAKFLFMGPNATLKPFVQADLRYRSLEGSSAIDIGAGGGAEYFVNRNMGVFASVGLFQFNLSDEEGGIGVFDSGFGLLGTSVGVEWFF